MNKTEGRRKLLITSARTRSYKKDDEPLLNLTGAMSRGSTEKVLVELKSPLYTQGV